MKHSVALCALLLATAATVAPSSFARVAACKPVKAVFYESSDWARLANGLAANPSSCTDYYVTIPALAADKTQMRPGAALQLRGLGPNFHALAEINYGAWQAWVLATGNSWYAAGVEARRRMTAAGFDIAAGDTWVVNEFSSSVRAGTGGARQNVRDLVRGLFEGDGSQSAAKGMIFVVGVGQSGISFPQYKATMESWLQDQNFWNDMTSYVSDFFQEVYGDVRNYAVAGVDPATRAAYLNGFLQHLLQLAQAVGAPAAEAGARNYLSGAYGPLANASWAWGSAYGWTKTTSDVMSDYVAAQTYAMRLAGGSRIGFAWNPLNSIGLSNDDFLTQVSAVLTRLVGSIHETDGGDPTQACAITGCSSVLTGAAPVTAWSTFSTWTPTEAVFTSPSLSVSTGAASGPITVQLQTGGVNTTLPVPSTVTISSSSRSGTFATDPTGPWSPTLGLTIPAGSGTATLYAQDTAGGSPMFSANLGGQVVTQIESIIAPAQSTTTLATPPPPPPVRVASLTFTPQQGHLHIELQIVDDSGQPLQGRATLALLRDAATVASTSGHTNPAGQLGLTAQQGLALGCYRARVEALAVPGYLWDNAVPADTYCVRTLPAHVATASFGRRNGRLHVGLRVTNDLGRPLQARMAFKVLHGASVFAATAGRTGPTGWLALTASPKLVSGCYRAAVTSLSAPSYRWDRLSPVQRFCVH